MSEPKDNDELLRIINLKKDKKYANTICIFETKDSYVVYEEDTETIAKYIFGNDIRRGTFVIDGKSYLRLYFNQNLYEKVVKDTLLKLQMNLVQFHLVSKKWEVKFKGTPHEPKDFEDVLGDCANFNQQRNAVAIKFTVDGKIATNVEVAFVNDYDYLVSCFKIPYDTTFNGLENALVAMAAKEAVVYHGDSKANQDSYRKLEALLKKMQLKYKLVDEERSLKFSEDERFSAVFVDVNCLKELSLASSRNLYQLLDEMNLLNSGEIGDGFTYKEYNLHNYISLNSAAVEALELFHISGATYDTDNSKGTLMSMMNKCSSTGGKRMLEEWIRRPLINASEINERLDVVEAFVNNDVALRMLSTNHLKKLPDLTSITRRVMLKKAFLKDAVNVYGVVFAIGKYRDLLDKMDFNKNSNCERTIKRRFTDKFDEFGSQLNNFTDKIKRAFDFERLRDKNEYRLRYETDAEMQQYGNEMDECEAKAKEIQREVHKSLSKKEGFKKEDSIKLQINQDNEFFLKCKSDEHAVIKDKKEMTILSNTKGGGCQFTNGKLSAISEMYTERIKMFKQVEEAYIVKILELLYSNKEHVRNLLEVLNELDVFISFAEFSTNFGSEYVRPVILENNETDRRTLEMKKVRHAVVERNNQINYVSNDVLLSTEEGKPTFCLITGPNMGGKSTYLRSIALSVILGQIGCFVPCESARWHIFDGIYTRIGSRDYQERGISTFMDEMLDAKNVICGSTKLSLCIVDELGRGTNNFDGCGIAYAIAENLIEKKCFCLYATHYSELAILKEEHPVQVECKKAACTLTDDKRIILLYTFINGVSERSFGLEIAHALNLPADFMESAHQFYDNFGHNN
uniref:DNA_MISMATCH_REPAIR_2 domain-containing protein n=1 Tax=Rhabditophanes sp. KR3021 TaxID=114890 RepID=A0AC35UBU5_9BILA